MARILLIDDDSAARAVCAEVMADAGHEVAEAASGEAGIEALRATRPDLVVCDVEMPGLDGYAVLQAVRRSAELAATPFLFLTGRDAATHLRGAMSLGADDYLNKPLSARELLAAVEARLARREQGREEADRRVREVQRSVTFLLPHELRTPLTTILAGSDLLVECHATLTPDQVASTARAIQRAAERLHRMAENYILHARMELDRLAARRGPASALAGRTGREAVGAAARAQAEDRGRAADVRLRLDEGALPVAEPYGRKIVAELVDNALKFSEAGQPVEVALEGGAEGAAGRLTVTDHGRGLTGAEVAQVSAFLQFRRESFEQQGSGLGLAIVRALVEATGGEFTLESRPGEATVARATWPAAG